MKHSILIWIGIPWLLAMCIYISSLRAFTHTEIKDTTTIPVKQFVDTIIDVNGLYALFIGDSHTANHESGWQTVLCEFTGMKMNNISIGGKTTYWMQTTAKTNVTSHYNYCFIYGGANDMYSQGIKPETALHNVQKIVDLCNRMKVHAVVITGFDPVKCTRTNNLQYPARYAKLQQLFMDSIKGADVIDTRVVDRKDCWDNLCHMAPSGHKKIADKIILDMKFKRK